MSAGLSPWGPDAAGRGPRLWALALVLAWTFLAFTLIPYSHGDEGNSLAEGLRWFRDGEVIHRDFFEFLPPLSFAVTGLLQLAFGPGLLASRLFTLLLLLFSAWQLMRLARSLGAGPWVATLPGLALVGLLHPLFPGYSHHWLALSFSLGAMQAVLADAASAQPGAWRPWALAGFLACGAGLCVQSDGVAVVLSLALWAAWWVLARGQGLRAWLGRALAFAGGLLALALPVLLYFAWQGALGTALSLWVLWPLAHYRQAGGMNDATWAMDLGAYLGTNGPWLDRPTWYAGAFRAVGLLAAGPLAMVLAWAWGARAWRGLPTAQTGALALCWLLGAWHLLVAIQGKADLPHLALYSAPALLLLAALASHWARLWRGPGEALLARLPALALAAWVLSGAWAQVGLMRLEPTRRPHWPGPDAWWRAQPLVQALAALPPGSRLAAFPYGGHFYVYGPRPAVGIHMFMPPSAGFHSPEEGASFWRDVAQKQPYLLFAPYVAGLAQPWPAYEVAAPGGYALVGAYPSPQYPGLGAWLYRPLGQVKP